MQLKSRKTCILKNPSYFKYRAFFFQPICSNTEAAFDVDVDVDV